ncbi:C2H2-type domain-containing protein [Fusarium sp. Ph1]|nr:C2H2-type domain-containing protein [Fusarium sp. Ph1]
MWVPRKAGGLRKIWRFSKDLGHANKSADEDTSDLANGSFEQGCLYYPDSARGLPMFRIVEFTNTSVSIRDSFGEGVYIDNNRSDGLCSTDCHHHRLAPLDFAFIAYKSPVSTEIEVRNKALENTLIDVLGRDTRLSQFDQAVWNSADLLDEYDCLEKRLKNVIYAPVGSVTAQSFLPLRLLVNSFLAQEYEVILPVPQHVDPSDILWDVLPENDRSNMREFNLFEAARDSDIGELLSTQVVVDRLSYQISEALSENQVNKELPGNMVNVNGHDVRENKEGETALPKAAEKGGNSVVPFQMEKGAYIHAKDNSVAAPTHNHSSGARARSYKPATNDDKQLLVKPKQQPRIKNPREAKAAVRAFFIRQYSKVRQHRIFEQVRGRFSNSTKAWRFGMEALEKISHGYTPQELGMTMAILCVCKAVVAALHAHDTSHCLSYDSIFERDLPRWVPLFHGSDRDLFNDAALNIWKMKWYMWETPSNLDYHDLFQRAERLTANLIATVGRLLALPTFAKQWKSGEIKKRPSRNKQRPPKDPDPGGLSIGTESTQHRETGTVGRAWPRKSLLWAKLMAGAIFSMLLIFLLWLYDMTTGTPATTNTAECCPAYFQAPWSGSMALSFALQSHEDLDIERLLSPEPAQNSYTDNVENIDNDNGRDCTSTRTSYYNCPIRSLFDRPVTSIISSALGQPAINPVDSVSHSPVASTTNTTAGGLLAPTANDRYTECIAKRPRAIVEESIHQPK